MVRRKQNLFAEVVGLISRLPWWLGVVFAIAAHAGLHLVAVGEVAVWGMSFKIDEWAGQRFLQSLAYSGQYVLPAIFLLGAAVSAYGRYTRRALQEHATVTPDRGELNAMSWKQFEALVGEAFRCKGYKVTMTGGSGPDGAVDLVLKKGEAIFLVQCRQWRDIQIGVNIVRDLHRMMASKGAAGGFVLTTGVFTEEARSFARGKHIELMGGKALRALIRGVRVPGKIFRDPLSVMTTGAPFCPECQSRMVMRKAKHGSNTGKPFWRCSQYPQCKGTRPA